MIDRRKGVNEGGGAATPLSRGLRFRLALTHLAIAVLAIVVVGVIVVYTGSRRFDSYLAQVQSKRNAAVVTSLQSTYKPPDGWDATAIYALSQVALFNNVDVAVYDTERPVAVHRPGQAHGTRDDGRWTGHDGRQRPGDDGRRDGRGHRVAAGDAARPRRLRRPERADRRRRAAGGERRDLRAQGRQGRRRGRLPERADAQPRRSPPASPERSPCW